MDHKRMIDRMWEKRYLLPIVFIMGILPLIMKMYEYDTHLGIFPWYGNDNRRVDLFNYYKQIFFLIVCGVMLLSLLIQMVREDGWRSLKKQYALFPLAVYALMAVLSTVCSDYRWFATHGITGHFETVYVLLGYCLTAIYCSYFVRSREDVMFLLRGWGICLIPMILLGLSQIAGHDFYATPLGKSLFLPREAREAGRQVNFEFETGRVYLSLYNPNYVGAFCELAFPVLAVMSFWASGKREKGFFLLLALGVLICMIGASAKTAFLVLPFAMLLLVLLLRRDAARHKAVFLAAVAAVALLIVGIDLTREEKFSQALERALTVTEVTYDLEELVTEKEDVKVVYRGNTLLIRCVLNEEGMMGFALRDGDGRTLPGRAVQDEQNGSSFVIEDERFSNIILLPVQLGNFPGFSVRIDGRDWLFSNYTGYEGYYYYSPYGKFTKMQTAPSIGFEGYERIATGRGYIWSRTIPLAKKHLLLGSGPDTFLLEFPQNDYLSRERFLGNQLLSKPHNIYLQMAVQTGGVSVIAFLAFYLIYFVGSVRLYWRRGSESDLSRAGAAICAATAGYMMVGFTTDSSINTAPIFWCLMGIGLAVNRLAAQPDRKSSSGAANSRTAGTRRK